MKNFTKDNLKTGTFGEMSDGSVFVVVNDTLVYEKGGYDSIRRLDDDLSYFCNRIMKVSDNAISFNTFRSFDTPLIYDRNAIVEMTIEEIEKKLGIKNLKIKGEN